MPVERPNKKREVSSTSLFLRSRESLNVLILFD